MLGVSFILDGVLMEQRAPFTAAAGAVDVTLFTLHTFERHVDLLR